VLDVDFFRVGVGVLIVVFFILYAAIVLAIVASLIRVTVYRDRTKTTPSRLARRRQMHARAMARASLDSELRILPYH
jgi:hypothetical protein